MPLALMGDEGSKKQVLNPNKDPLPTNVNQNSAFDSNGIPLFGTCYYYRGNSTI